MNQNMRTNYYARNESLIAIILHHENESDRQINLNNDNESLILIKSSIG